MKQKFNLYFSFAVIFVALSLLGACVDYSQPEYVERPVDDIYNEAMDTMHGGHFRDAVKAFDEVERQHPYSSWATKAQLMAAYALYQNNDYDESIIYLDRFIQLHPSNRDIAYAYYLKSLSYYEQISEVSRDQKMTKLAMKTMGELVARYPDSKYARDAKVKLDLTNDHLAGKEMHVGRYYLVQRHYLAAINRFKAVIDKYQTTTHVPEALYRLTESYYALGLDDEAKKMAAILGHNFPGSEWYIDSYELLKNIQFRPVKDAAWYDFWSSKPIAHVKAQPPASKNNWYNFWSDANKDKKKKATDSAEKNKSVVIKPATKDSWYKFWGPPRIPEDTPKKDNGNIPQEE